MVVDGRRPYRWSSGTLGHMSKRVPAASIQLHSLEKSGSNGSSSSVRQGLRRSVEKKGLKTPSPTLSHSRRSRSNNKPSSDRAGKAAPTAASASKRAATRTVTTTEATTTDQAKIKAAATTTKPTTKAATTEETTTENTTAEATSKTRCTDKNMEVGGNTLTSVLLFQEGEGRGKEEEPNGEGRRATRTEPGLNPSLRLQWKLRTLPQNQGGSPFTCQDSVSFHFHNFPIIHFYPVVHFYLAPPVQEKKSLVLIRSANSQWRNLQIGLGGFA